MTADLMIEASRGMHGASEGHPTVFNAVETLLKGIEVALPEGRFFLDKDGHTRHHVRTRWWDTSATNYESASLLEEGSSGLPDLPLPDHALFWSDEGSPVFVGHYWLSGTPQIQTSKVAVIDYSVAKGGKLVAYRFNGELRLTNENLFWVGQEQLAQSPQSASA